MSPMQYAKLHNNIQSDVLNQCAQILESKRVTLLVKRGIDVAFSILLLFILLPIMVVISVAIAIDSPGGVLFMQERAGRYGKPFKILKFRTMTKANSGSNITTGNDMRITRVGKLIRKIRFDEFPQLINVIKGDMSIIGPRPETMNFVDIYTADQRATLLVRPGISCRSSIAFADEADMIPEGVDTDKFYVENILPEKCEMNIKYIKDLSIKEDICVAFLTVARVFK